MKDKELSLEVPNAIVHQWQRGNVNIATQGMGELRLWLRPMKAILKNENFPTSF